MATAKIIIKAQDQTKQGVTSAKKNLQGLDEVVSAFGINIGKLTSIAGVAAALAGLAKAAKECTDAFLATESTYLSLQASFNDSSSYNIALDNINKLAEVSLASKKNIAALYAQLAGLGKSNKEIEKLMNAAIAFSNVTGKDLQGSLDGLLDTLKGSVGYFDKYIPEIMQLTKEELAAGKAIDLVNNKLGDLGKTISEQSYSQTIKNINDHVTSIKENLGQALLDAASPFLDMINGVLDKIDDALQKLNQSNAAYKKVLSYEEVEKLYKDVYSGNKGIQSLGLNINSREEAEYLADLLFKNFESRPELFGKDQQFYDTVINLVESILSEEEVQTITQRDIKKEAEQARSASTLTKYQEQQSLLFAGLSKDISAFLDGKDITAPKDESLAGQISSLSKTIEEASKWISTWQYNEGSRSDSNYIALNNVVVNATKSMQDLLDKAIDDVTSTYSNLLGISNEDSITADYLDDLIKAAQSSGVVGEDTLETLIQLRDWVEKGIDPNTSTLISGIYSKYTKYLSEESQKQLTITNLLDSLETVNEAIDKVSLAVEEGLADQSDLDLLKEIAQGISNTVYEMRNSKPSGSDISTKGDALQHIEDFFSQDSADDRLNDYLIDKVDSLFDSIEPFVNVLMSSNAVVATAAYVFGELVGNLEPLINECIEPLTSLLDSIFDSVADWFVPLLEGIRGTIQGVVSILSAILIPVLDTLAPIIKLCTVAFKILEGPLKLVAEAFVYVAAVIDVVADSIEWAIGSFLNWIASLNLFGWKPFEGLGGNDVQAPDFNRSLEEIRNSTMTDITEGFHGTGEDESTQTSVKNASYSGGSTFYFNIYQQAPVVGDGGMEEFAKMLKAEFAELAYYGA